MEKCLYYLCHLNEDAPPNDRTSCLEHIVPYSIGGSGEFGIRYCSTKANSDFGTKVDGPFIALPLVGMKRHELKLKGYGGTIPDIRAPGRCQSLGTECDVVFTHDGDVYADFGLTVDGGLESGTISFAGSEDKRLRLAVEGFLKKAERKGHDVLNENLTPIENYQHALDGADVQTAEQLSFTLNFDRDTFFLPWSKGILKITLGLGAFALGKKWAFGATADVMRRALQCNDPEALLAMKIRGTTTSMLTPDLMELLDVRCNRHTLAVLPYDGGMLAVVSLFGGQLFDSIIDLGNDPADASVVGDELPRSWECVFHIDPMSRTLTRETIEAVMARCP